MVQFPLLFTVSATLGAICSNAAPVINPMIHSISKIPVHMSGGPAGEPGRSFPLQGVSTVPIHEGGEFREHRLHNEIPIHREGGEFHEHRPEHLHNEFPIPREGGMIPHMRIGMAGAPRDLEERSPIYGVSKIPVHEGGEFREHRLEHFRDDIPIHREGGMIPERMHMRVGLAGAPRDLEERSPVYGVSKIPVHEGGEFREHRPEFHPFVGVSKIPVHFGTTEFTPRIGLAGAPRDLELEERSPVETLHYGTTIMTPRIGLAGAPRDLEYLNLEERSKIGNFFKKVGGWFKDNIGTVVDVGSKLAKVIKV
jgi:hypothetical protein